MGKRAKEKQKKENIIGFFLIFLVIIVIAVFAYFRQSITSSRIITDKETHCPVDGVTKRTIVLVDRSSIFAPTLAESVKRRINKIKHELDVHESIQIFTVGDINRKIRVPVFDMCNPGKGDDANEWIANQPMIKKKWVEQFSKEMKPIVDSLTVPKPSEERSPIFESIESISVTSIDKSIHTKIYIFSDFIQNVSDFSQYKNPDPFNFDKFEQTEYGKNSIQALHGAEIYMLVFKTKHSNNELGYFWERWFRESMGRVREIEPIP